MKKHLFRENDALSCDVCGAPEGSTDMHLSTVEQLAIVNEISERRLHVIKVSADVLVSLGQNSGAIESGGYRGWWRAVNGQAFVYAIEKI
jgi:hypothetical protein